MGKSLFVSHSERGRIIWSQKVFTSSLLGTLKVNLKPLWSYTSVFQRKRSETAESMNTPQKCKLDTTFAKAIQGKHTALKNGLNYFLLQLRSLVSLEGRMPHIKRGACCICKDCHCLEWFKRWKGAQCEKNKKDHADQHHRKGLERQRCDLWASCNFWNNICSN